MVGGLAEGDARALLEAAVVGPLDERVRDRIVAETGGNPRALLELALGVTPGELAGGFGLPRAVVLPARIEDDFRRQLAPLPPATRLLLLVAAAEPVGDPVLLWRAAGRLGVAAEAAAPATAARLIEFDGLVRFRHPLGRAAVYQEASPRERQRVHHALAEATDPGVDPDRRAWHRALAASGMDEDVAVELERSAGRARAPRWPGRRGRVRSTGRRVDARPGPAGPSGAGRGGDQVPGRRAGGGAAAAQHGAGRAAGRAGARASGVAARSAGR